MKQFLAPPIFDDDEKTRVAGLLHAIVLTAAGLTAFLCVALPIALPQARNGLLYVTVLFGLELVTMLLNRRGHVRAAARVFVVGLWLFMTVLVYALSGLSGANWMTYVSITLIAGLVWSRRAGFVVAVASALTALAVIVFERGDWLPSPAVEASLPAQALGLAANLLTAMMLLHLATRSLSEALTRVRHTAQAMAERNRDLLAEIHERQRVQEALAESEERLRRIIDTSAEGIWAIDADNVTTLVNRKMADMLGYTVEEMIGTPLFAFMDDEGRSIAARNVERRRQGITERHDFRFVRKDGTPLWAELNTSPIYDAHGQYAGALAMISDITEQRQAQQRLLLNTLALNAAANGIVITDRDGTVQWANAAFTALTGYSVEEIVGRKPSLLASGRHDAAFYADMWNTILAGRVWRGELINRRKDGSLYIEEQTITPVRDAQGDITHFIAIKQDISERKRTEAALKYRYDLEALIAALSAKFISLPLDEIDAGINDALRAIGEFAGVDRSYVFLYSDDGLYLNNTHEWCADGIESQIDRLQGLTTDAFPWFKDSADRLEAIHIPRLDDLPPQAQAERRAFQARGVQSLVIVPMAHGRSRSLGFLGFDAVRAEKTWPPDSVALLKIAGEIFINALERKRVETALRDVLAGLEQRVAERTRELAEANERLTDLDRLKTKFVSDVSHELRTPVTNLGLYLNLLQHGKPDKRESYQAVLRQQIDRLRDLIEDIISLSALDLEQDQSRHVPIAVNALVAPVVDLYRPHAESAGLSLSVDLQAQDATILGSVDHLAQVVKRLVVNAVNYTQTGGVRVCTQQVGGEVCLEVTDSGPGIHPEDIPHLFERFYRGRGAAQSPIPGNGLGLAIVKEIVERHAGRVEIESSLGVGSTFRVWLPLNGHSSSPPPAPGATTGAGVQSTTT
jgi:PAS domain S-box-containing protein